MSTWNSKAPSGHPRPTSQVYGSSHSPGPHTGGSTKQSFSPHTGGSTIVVVVVVAGGTVVVVVAGGTVVVVVAGGT
ncbi:MAG: hypothetical protein WD883_03125, partial [Candidatus Colwellbacteria bacterium]